VRHTLSIETTTHGRILVEDAADVVSPRLLVTFHGYGQSARTILEEVARIPGIDAWRVASVQGLHRFYTRDDQSVVASWMTREDRELAIADNLAYVDKAVEILGAQGRRPVKLVFLGFSQGVAMAYRAAMSGVHRADGVIALAGDIPPELKVRASSEGARPWPPVLIGSGWHDKFYGTDKVHADVSFLGARGIAHEVVRFHGGHEWTEEFRQAAGRWLATIE
jgi:predicted esterase